MEHARADRQAALDRLIDFLRIPSVSTDPAHRSDMGRAAEWLAARLRAAGAESVRIDPTPGHPVVYAESRPVPGAPTLLVYGHYDVQPPDPLELWQTPPFEPEIRGGDLYARGACDDKGQLMCHVEALAAYSAAGLAPPVHLKFVFEGEEEIGSPNLVAWLRAHAAELGADVAAISDNSMVAPGQPSIVYGLRGLAYLEVEVTGPPGDLHSGIYGGAVRNPANALAELIAGMHDAEGRVTIEGFYDRVRPLDDEERALLAQVPFGEAAFQRATGEAGRWGEAGYSVVERLGARPTLDVNGMWSGFTGAGAKTVLPSKAHAKISMRLVPDQDPVEIAALFEAHVRAHAPAGCQVKVSSLHGGYPALIDRDLPAMRAASSAFEQAFGKKPVFTREGGTIPVVADLAKILGLPTVMLGFGLPDDNLHAPNEKFRIEHYHKGTETVIAFLDALAEAGA
jgi:acetylornithine deacetylase/succinyl-diaminopimelate desuccinylase-like protein